ncbi:unnamed protein product [Paramecium pentaurelia]|uniref:Uncharacterized protein n=1 Tax=Paramecium pentaurelia TaxID=43138 RepID=A0A8S1TQ46_9CILI|nr:unnamed protein product [Paramecium pentaurelia]
MSQNKSLQDFERDHGKTNDLKSIRNSKCLFYDKDNSQIIYKLEMNQSKSPQWQAQIEKEIELQNKLASNFKQYLKIIDHAYQVIEQNQIIYMTIQTREGNNNNIFSFEEINDNIDKFMKFKNIFQHMSDMEKNNPKIFYLQNKNIFYQGNQLYLTIFGCIQDYKLSIDSNLNLKELEELTNKVNLINYKDEKNKEKQHKIQKYREDICILFQFSILKIENKEISIHEINNKCKEDKELKNIAQILIDYIFKDISIEQVNLSLKQSDESEQIYQTVLENWKKLQMQLQSKLEQHDLELFKLGLDLILLKELQNKQLQIYISIQKEIYENGNRNDNGNGEDKDKDKNKNKNKYNGNVQEKAKQFILQAEHRQQAINLMQNQNKDPHPNLIYFLNEKELNQLKDDKNLLKLFIQEDQHISANINKYLELLQKISSFALDQQVINNEQLQLIPAENLKTSQNNKIKELWKLKELEKQMKTHGVERFEFEKPLDARYFYEKFLLAINNNNPNENPLDYKLTFQQFTLLNEIRKKNIKIVF